MKIVMVVTSHSELGITGKKTGFWLDSFAVPYYVFKDAGAEITLASPKGGQPPLDPRSDEIDSPGVATERFMADQEAQEALAHTVILNGIVADHHDALMYPGGKGLLWDLVDNASSIALIESMYSQGKPVATVCHAAAVLCHARLRDGSPLVQGKSVTGYSNAHEIVVGLADSVPLHVEDELKKYGGIYSSVAGWDSYVVRDGNLITGQNPASSEAVAKTVLAQL